MDHTVSGKQQADRARVDFTTPRFGRERLQMNSPPPQLFRDYTYLESSPRDGVADARRSTPDQPVESPKQSTIARIDSDIAASDLNGRNLQVRSDFESVLLRHNQDTQKLLAENEWLRLQYQDAVDARKAFAQTQKARVAIVAAHAQQPKQKQDSKPQAPAYFVRDDTFFDTVFQDLQGRVKDFVEDHFSLDASPSRSHKIIETDIKSNARFRALRPDRQLFTSSPRMFLALKESCIWDFLYTEVFGGQYSGSKQRWAGDDAVHLTNMRERIFSVMTKEPDPVQLRNLHTWRCSTVNLLSAAPHHQELMTSEIEKLGQLLHETFRLSETEQPSRAFRNQAKRILKQALDMDLEMQKQRSHVFFRFPRLRKQVDGVWRARDLIAKSAQMVHWDESISTEPSGQVQLIVCPALVRHGTQDGEDLGSLEAIISKALVIEEQSAEQSLIDTSPEVLRAPEPIQHTALSTPWHTPPHSPKSDVIANESALTAPRKLSKPGAETRATSTRPWTVPNDVPNYVNRTLPNKPRPRSPLVIEDMITQAANTAISLPTRAASTKEASKKKEMPAGVKAPEETSHVAVVNTVPRLNDDSRRSNGGTPLSVKDRILSRRNAARQNISKALQSRTQAADMPRERPQSPDVLSEPQEGQNRTEAATTSTASNFFAIPEGSVQSSARPHKSNSTRGKNRAIKPTANETILASILSSSGVSTKDHAGRSQGTSTENSRASTRPQSPPILKPLGSHSHHRSKSDTIVMPESSSTGAASVKGASDPNAITPLEVGRKERPETADTRPESRQSRFRIPPMTALRYMRPKSTDPKSSRLTACFGQDGDSDDTDEDSNSSKDTDPRDMKSVASEGGTQFRAVDRLMRKQLVNSLHGQGNWRDRSVQEAVKEEGR